MNIAIEALSLSLDKLTGIGNVTLNYLRELEKADTGNSYYVYTIDELLHFNTAKKNWKHVKYDYRVKYIKYRVTDEWKKLRDAPSKSIAAALRMYRLRLMKMLLEAADTACLYFWLAWSLKKNGIDVYIGIYADFFPVLFFSRLRKIWLIHDLVWKLYPETTSMNSVFKNMLITRNMKKADLLLSVSENTRKDMIGLLDIRTEIITLHNAADPRVFYRADEKSVRRVKQKFGITKKYILSVCTIEPRKNLSALLDAYAMMKQRERYQLVLAGMSGWKNTALFGLIESNAAKESIIVTGYVPGGDLAPLYTGAEVFVFPTLYEGFGMPVLEAMQCGCPVISSASSSIPEVAGDACVLVDPMDVRALASSMETVLSDAKFRVSLRRKGLARSEQFSWKRSAGRLLEIIRGA
jgi:glycosyltransferase involved in cell wall biosynthesis